MKKTTFNLISIAVCILFFSCKDDLSTGNSSVTSGGSLTGKIVNYVPNSIDSLSAVMIHPVGSGKVSTKGDFSIGLTVMQLIWERKLSGVIMSDTTAMVAPVQNINSFLNSNPTGELIKCNYTNNSVTKVGMAYSTFIYINKSLTMNGTHVDTTTDGVKTETYNTFYNMTFTIGWNEVVTKITAYSSTSNCETLSVSLTNNITSDLQWRYFKSDYSNIRGELPGQVKAVMIFSLK
jgi:hypothetical protein